MDNFIISSNTKIVIGRESELLVGEEIKKYSNKILLHYGVGSIKKIGLYEKVVKSLKMNNIEFIELSGVISNPRVSLVREGIKICKENDISFILAIGGGSVIDSAKAIAIGVNNDEDIWDIFRNGKIKRDGLSLGVILTIAGSGSETSEALVINNEENKEKRLLRHKSIAPKFSILNPELTFTVPMYQTQCGVADLIAHILEIYFTPNARADLADRLCESTIKSLIDNGEKLLDDKENYDARLEILLGGIAAHSELLSVGRKGDFATHTIEHELSGLYDITHGAGISIILPAWMKYVYKVDINRFVQLANRVWNIDINYDNLEETALRGIEALKDFYKKIGLPTSLKEVYIDSSNFEYMAKRATKNGLCGNFVKLNKNDIINIYNLAL